MEQRDRADEERGARLGGAHGLLRAGDRARPDEDVRAALGELDQRALDPGGRERELDRADAALGERAGPAQRAPRRSRRATTEAITRAAADAGRASPPGVAGRAPLRRSRSRGAAATSTAAPPIAAAVPAAWPIAMHWAIERTEAWASCVAERHRPATSRLSEADGRRGSGDGMP